MPPLTQALVYVRWRQMLKDHHEGDTIGKLFADLQRSISHEILSEVGSKEFAAVEEALKKLQEAIKAFEKTAPGPDPNKLPAEFADSLIEPEGVPAPMALIYESLPSEEELASAFLNLTLLRQPPNNQVLPWVVFEGTLPGYIDERQRFLTLTSGVGQDTRNEVFWGKRLILLGQNLRRGEPNPKSNTDETMVLLGGKKMASLPGQQFANSLASLFNVVAGAVVLGKNVSIIRNELGQQCNLNSICSVAIRDAPLSGACGFINWDEKQQEAWGKLCRARSAHDDVATLAAIQDVRDDTNYFYKEGREIPEATQQELLKRAEIKKLKPTIDTLKAILTSLNDLLNDDLGNLKKRSVARIMEGLVVLHQAPSAPLFSDAKLTDDLNLDEWAGYDYELKICRGAAPCDDKTEVKDITAYRSVRVWGPHRIVSTATEISGAIGKANVPLGGCRFQPVGGVGGPDQFYRLEPQDDWRRRVTISQLLVLYPFGHVRNRILQGLAFAVGPSIFEGNDTAFLKQWNLRLGWEPWFVQGVIITMGASVRSVEAPSDMQAGTIVSVPRGSSSDPPAFATAAKNVWLFSVGMALDLAVVGEGVVKLFKNEEPKAGGK